MPIGRRVQQRYRDGVRHAVLKWLFATLLALFVGASGAARAGQTPSGVQGSVTLSPNGPECVDAASCSKPARRVLLLFSHDGGVRARVTTSAKGTYRVLLPPGRYSVTTTAFRRGSGVTPRVVRVRSGRISTANLTIDTGMQ